MPPKKKTKESTSEVKVVDVSNEPSLSSSSSSSSDSDPLKLDSLFQDGEYWLPLLKPVIQSQPEALDFIGPSRQETVVPLRELTFQALKPNPPGRWNVVIFGQNPYPRIESATGIAMFDSSITSWEDSRFSKVVTMRCLIKAAAMWKYGIDFHTPVAEVRKLLRSKDIVPPDEWFQALLSQGCLLLNAALTASSDSSVSTSKHATFWKPVVRQIVEEILRAKSEAGKGVVFAWWGVQARSLRKIVDQVNEKYSVPIEHIEHHNPAAQGDMFCSGNHFKELNDSLSSLGLPNIDFLPEVGWRKKKSSVLSEEMIGGGGGGAGTGKKTTGKKSSSSSSTSSSSPSSSSSSSTTTEYDSLKIVDEEEKEEEEEDEDEVDRMGLFISQTRELHKMYLERLQGVKDEKGDSCSVITGVASWPGMKLPSFEEEVIPSLRGVCAGVEAAGRQAMSFAEKKYQQIQSTSISLTSSTTSSSSSSLTMLSSSSSSSSSSSLTQDHIASLHLYTLQSAFYREVNATLRDKKRKNIDSYIPYLRLLFSAMRILIGGEGGGGGGGGVVLTSPSEEGEKEITSITIPPPPSEVKSTGKRKTKSSTSHSSPTTSSSAPGLLSLPTLPTTTTTPLTLWRGVNLDLSSQYPQGGEVTWWGVSSCTIKRGVAEGFMGGGGKCTLFHIVSYTAVSISTFSAFAGEEEFILRPGTQLRVIQVKKGSLNEIHLEELPHQCQVH